ncbi:MAG: hypothetical protein H6738_16200 [Alphaproteobacteria bacterium]|nr:hypothetical protein [Alphaproteobacteria bacterium]MCB9698322.1 hypothetical protein [Alphaproteobacteria bacterium]
MTRASILALVALTGCLKPEPYTGAFDVPVAAAVLQPEVGGPFLEPVGLVANQHGGEILPLALKQGRFLTDDPTVSFLRGNPLATGGLRVLTSVAVTSRGTQEVTAWAGDQRFETLIRVPWILDCASEEPRPECESPSPVAPVEQEAFVEVLSTPDGLTIEDLRVKKGYTTTETWTVRFDGSAWTVEGSRSGPQPDLATTGVPYSSQLHRIGFTIRGSAKVGDTFVVKTRNGIEEIGVGGAPEVLSLAPDLQTLAMVVHDTSQDLPVVRWFDTATQTVLGTVALPADARPHRLTWTEDGALLVADREHPAVWEVEVGATVALEHPMPWPTLDVAELSGDRSKLWVVPITGQELWVFDRETDAPVDSNPSVPGDQGLRFQVDVVGIEAMRLPYRMPELTDDLIRRYARSVAVSLSSGSVVFAHEDEPCLVQDPLGPRSALDANSTFVDYSASFVSAARGIPVLEEVGSSGRHVVVDRCAGTAQTETWTLRYDEQIQAWRVRGTWSGEQQAVAYEDERYLSDRGEISFTVRAGHTPTRDGWSIRFSVDNGVAAATGDLDGDKVRDVDLGVGGDPVYFEYRVGIAGPIGDHDGEGWVPVDLRPLVLVPGISTNEVGRVDPQDPLVDVGWQ